MVTTSADFRAPPPRPEAREGEQRPVFAERKPVGVLRGVVGAYSQNDVAGTRHRFLAESHPRQCGLETLRMLVTGWPPNCGGPGMPQRAMTSSRSPSEAARMIGAIWSGKMADRGGRLPARSCLTANRSRMADWPLLTL